MNQDIDIIFILNKIKELEKLKYLMLKTDQLELFNYFPKHILLVDENKNMKLKTEVEIKQISQLSEENLKTSFSNIEKKESDDKKNRH